MPSYSMEQLAAMDDSQLRAIAEELNSENKNSSNRQEIIYGIIDAQAIQQSEQRSDSPRRRQRIVKHDGCQKIIYKSLIAKALQKDGNIGSFKHLVFKIPKAFAMPERFSGTISQYHILDGR